MKTNWAVGILISIFASFAMMLCVSLVASTCPGIAWCAEWVGDEHAIQQYGILAVAGLVILLVIVSIYGRALRNRAFNTGATISHYYEASVPMLWGALGLYYTLKLIAWESLNSKLALYGALFFAAIFGLFFLQTFVSGLSNFLRWQMLEAKNLEWAFPASGGKALFRVIYRRADGSTLIDITPHEKRGVQELNYRRTQRATVISSIIALVLAIIARPIAYDYSQYLGWAVTYLVLGPALTKVGTDLIYTAAYHTAGQYIPGAKLLDAAPERISPKQLEKDMPYGAAPFVEGMAQQMKSKIRT